jgi:hypothetical protein
VVNPIKNNLLRAKPIIGNVLVLKNAIIKGIIGVTVEGLFTW